MNSISMNQIFILFLFEAYEKVLFMIGLRFGQIVREVDNPVYTKREYTQGKPVRFGWSGYGSTMDGSTDRRCRP